MAWTLSEFSKIETDVLRKSVIDCLLYDANLLELVPMETIGQLATTVIQYKDLPSVGFRKINEGYSETTGTFKQKTETISLLGADIDTDIAIAEAKNTVADARAIQQLMVMKTVAYTFNDKFINGDPVTDPEEFQGITSRITDIVADGFPGQYIDIVEVDQLPGDEAANNVFLDALDTLIYSIKGHNPDALLMNSKALLAIRSILRRNKLLNTAQDSFGRIIDMYGNIRLIAMGVKADQTTEIIPFDETLGGGTGETSIYAVKFGIGDMLWGIQQYPVRVKDLGELEAKPVFRTRVDFPLGLASVDPRCMSRLYGMKVA